MKQRRLLEQSAESADRSPPAVPTSTPTYHTYTELTDGGKYRDLRLSMGAVLAWNGPVDGRVPFGVSVRLLLRIPPPWPLQLLPHINQLWAQTFEGETWCGFHSLLPKFHLLPLPCHRLLLLLLHQQEKKVIPQNKYHIVYFRCLLQVHSLYKECEEDRLVSQFKMQDRVGGRIQRDPWFAGLPLRQVQRTLQALAKGEVSLGPQFVVHQVWPGDCEF